MNKYVFQDSRLIYERMGIIRFFWRWFFIPSFKVTTLFRLVQNVELSSNYGCKIIRRLGGVNYSIYGI